MNITTPTASQDRFTGLAEVFPQPMIDLITGKSKETAVSLILALFDAGGICAGTAERWLTALENLEF